MSEYEYRPIGVIGNVVFGTIFAFYWVMALFLLAAVTVYAEPAVTATRSLAGFTSALSVCVAFMIAPLIARAVYRREWFEHWGVVVATVLLVPFVMLMTLT